MNNLYNSLINGRAYTKDTGEVVVTPPSAIELRAAAALKQIADINANNLMVINQLQQREQDSLAYAGLQQQAINNLLHEVNELTKEKEKYDQNIRDAGRQTSDVGSRGGNAPTSNPDGERGSSA